MNCKKDSQKIRSEVKKFFNGSKYVYATPDTANHSANFYGDTTICKLSQRDVYNSIACAYGEWSNDLDDVIGQVCGDLQHDRPEA